jgi:hypothetical protein
MGDNDKPVVGVDESGATIQDDPPAGEEANKNKGSFQDRIDELTKKGRDFEREALYYKGLYDGILQAGVSPGKGSGPSGDPNPPVELDPDDFDTPADYHKAVAKQAKDELAREVREQEKKREQASRNTVINKQYVEGRKNHVDFDAVALSPSVQVTTTMFEAAMGDNLSGVLYHLGKNPEEAARIAALPATQQVKEIGKIEDKITAKPPVKPSGAPNPPTNISGVKGTPGTKSDDEKTRAELHAEWNKKRRKEAGLE